MSKLTDTFLRAIKPTGKTQKISDGKGLYINVTPTGSRATGGMLWRMAYRFNGKQKTLSFGAYPIVTLQDARRKRDEAKALLANGVDPGEHKKAVKAALRAEVENTFEIIAREWYAAASSVWSEKYKINVTNRLERYVFPIIGTKPINKIMPPDVLEILRPIEQKGAIATAHGVLINCGQIFNYAIKTCRTAINPAAALRGTLKQRKTVSRASLKDPKQIGILLKAIDEYTGYHVIRDALRLAPYVFVRPKELRLAEWSEFDLDAAEWHIPAEKMKMREKHIVPLSRQAVDILRDLHQYTGHSRFAFPSMWAKNKSRSIAEMALSLALRRMGYTKDEMTVHGFRSMASTLLNEQGYNRDWIERQLAHSERNGVRAAYNYADYLPERRRMMQEWADYLDSLKAKASN